jgi:hypothetical protein
MATSGSATDPAVGDDYVRGGDQLVNRRIPAASDAPARVPADHVPSPSSLGIAASNPNLSGFNELTHRDQRLAGTGAYANTQFSLEPPDQALCVGNGFVVESVNTDGNINCPPDGAGESIPPVPFASAGASD